MGGGSPQLMSQGIYGRRDIVDDMRTITIRREDMNNFNSLLEDLSIDEWKFDLIREVTIQVFEYATE